MIHHPLTDLVLLWSGEHGAYWRADRSGYTEDDREAGRYTLAEAEEIARACGPEKRLEIRPDTTMSREPGDLFDAIPNLGGLLDSTVRAAEGVELTLRDLCLAQIRLNLFAALQHPDEQLRRGAWELVDDLVATRPVLDPDWKEPADG